jgi:hypothetical protein
LKASSLPLLLTGCVMEVDVGRHLREPSPPVVDSVDQDNDGYSEAEGDCDDFNADAGPAGWEAEFAEACDGIDNNCSGDVDEGVCIEWDSWTQTLQLDVLFVVDTSLSMEPYLSRLGDGTTDFLYHLVGAPFDTHIGVVTMDVHDPDTTGELVSVDGRQFLIGNDPKLDIGEARQWLTTALTEHSAVSGSDPGGRAAVDAAFATAADGEAQWNQGFLRDSAALTIVFVSDREDASVSPDVVRFLNNVEAVKKGTLSKVTIHTITQLDDYACDGLRSAETRGASYATLRESTAGIEASICDDDYSLSALGQVAATEGLETRFPLALAAQTGSVKVSVELPGGLLQQLGADEFALQDSNRTVVLTGDPLPPAGSVILIDYLEQP